jgi:hypothetical protein
VTNVSLRHRNIKCHRLRTLDIISALVTLCSSCHSKRPSVSPRIESLQLSLAGRHGSQPAGKCIAVLEALSTVSDDLYVC